MTSITEANFLGRNGQFIMAGSDDGKFFNWDRKTTNIVKVLVGHEAIVNCLQGHPTVPILDTLGIDPVVRIWQPAPEDGEEDIRTVGDLDAAVSLNQRRMNVDPFEAILHNMGYRFVIQAFVHHLYLYTNINTRMNLMRMQAMSMKELSSVVQVSNLSKI